MHPNINELLQAFGSLNLDDLITITIENGKIITHSNLTDTNRPHILISQADLDVLQNGGDNQIGMLNATSRYCLVRGAKGLEVDHVPSEESLRQKVFNENVPTKVRRQVKQEKAEINSNGKLVGFSKYMAYGRAAFANNNNTNIQDIENTQDSLDRFKKIETLSYVVSIKKDEHQSFSSTYHSNGIARQAYIDRIDDDSQSPYEKPRCLFDKENPEAAVYRDTKSIIDNTALRRRNNLKKTLALNENFTTNLGRDAKYDNNLHNALDRIGAYLKLYKSNIDFKVFDVDKPALKYSSKENMPAMYATPKGIFHALKNYSVDNGVVFKCSNKSHDAGEKMDRMFLKRIKKALG